MAQNAAPARPVAIGSAGPSSRRANRQTFRRVVSPSAISRCLPNKNAKEAFVHLTEAAAKNHGSNSQCDCNNAHQHLLRKDKFSCLVIAVEQDSLAACTTE